MKKKLFLISLILLLALAAAGCGGQKEESASASSDSGLPVMSIEDDEDTSTAEAEAEMDDERESEELGDVPENEDTSEADPANQQPDNALSGKTEEESGEAYIGTWKNIGFLMADGSVDKSFRQKQTFTFEEDGTYTFVDKTEGNEKEESGNWAVNSSNQLVIREFTLTISEEGYLLWDSGERDGKGRRLYYAFKKKE